MTQQRTSSSSDESAASSDHDDEVTVRDPVLRAEAQHRGAGWPAGPRLLAALSVLRVEEIVRTTNMEVLRKHKLTHARHAALALLYFSREGQLPLTKLSKYLMVHPTSVTATVDALERNGHTERVPHPTDRRTTLARITAKGRRAMEESTAAMGDRHWAVGALTESEAMQLYRLLAKVRVDAGEIDKRDVARRLDPQPSR